MHDMFGNYFGGKTQTNGFRGYLIDSAYNKAESTHSLLLLSVPFVVVAADGLADKAQSLLSRCHSNQEILTAVSGVVC